jgi:uncharacterized membrane-anchored protein YjiN (DUF445 family)
MKLDAAETHTNYHSIWWIATGLLCLMIVTFIVTSRWGSETNWLGYVRAFSEAAMVGALADWFAVTALFRHPLGIPIPHTAIVPSNKARIGRSLGFFIQKNFLSEEVLEEEAINITGHITRWLGRDENRRSVVRRVRLMIPRFLEAVEEAEIRALLDQQVEGVVRRLDVAKLFGKILSLLTVNGLHEVVLDELVLQSRSFFRANKDWFHAELRQSSPWFIPSFVDKKIAEAIITKSEETFAAALADRNHELRLRVHQAVLTFIDKLEHSEDFQKRGEEIRELLLQNDVFRGYVNSVRDGLIEALKVDVKKDDSQITAAIERILEGFVKTMSASPELQQRINRALRGVFKAAAGDQGNHVAEVVSRTIESWDTTTLVSKLEEQVGRDLQYIRINGTLVGGLVGLLLHSIEQVTK